MVRESMAAPVNWKAVFAAIPAQATARALQLALTPIAGGTPAAVDYGDYWAIEFTPDQETRVSEWILSQLRREPGPVRMETRGIALRVVARQYWPYAAGLVAVGAVLALALGKRRRR